MLTSFLKKITGGKFLFWVVTFYVTLSTKLNAQEIEWQNTIGGGGNDELYSIKQTTDGGYILGGTSRSNISGDKTENNWDTTQTRADYWIVKTDALGNIQWQNTIGGSGHDELYSILQTTDGGYIMGGRSTSLISGDKTENTVGGDDYWIVKTNSSGNIQWQNTIGGSGNDWLYSIKQTTDGGYILGGWSFSNISGDKTENSNGLEDYWIVKTDSLGNIQWQNTIGGGNSDILYSIQQTTDEGFILGGYSNSNISGDKSENRIGDYDFWIVKTDSSGNIEWQNTIGGNNSDWLNSIQQTTDGGFILGGRSNSNISGDKTENSWNNSNDYWIVKTDNSGNIQWQNTIGGNSYDYIYSIQQTTDGGFFLGGNSNSNISGDKTELSMGGYDYWIIKTDTSGNIQWQNTIGGSGNDVIWSIQQTIDGQYILGGWSNSNISGDKTENSIGLSDYWIVKICDSLSTISLCSAVSVNELVIDNNEVDVFPNPAKDELNIQLNNSKANNLRTVSIFDVLGNTVLSKQSATANCKLPTAHFSKGIYFVEVKTGKEVYRAKFVKSANR